MIGASARVWLAAGAALAGTGFACDPPQPTRLRVALRSSSPASAGGDLLEGDTIGVVRLDQAAPVTVASTPAGSLLTPFRSALGAAARPATSPDLTLSLPEMSFDELRRVPLDIVWFKDVSRDGAWQRGEPYATAWTGGVGGYRVILEPMPASRGLRWGLIEGGDPPTLHPEAAGIIVYIDPVRPSVER